jgi:hypothetical protein
MHHACWFLVALSAVAVSGCVLDERPGLRACSRGYWFEFRRGPSDGDLPILPSAVPGVEIASAAWQTVASTHGFSADVRLVYTSRIRTVRRLVLDSIALVYRADGSSPRFGHGSHDDGWSAIIDAELRPPFITAKPSVRRHNPEDRRHLVVPPGSVIRTEREMHIGNGLMVLSSTGADICPRSVELVPRQELLRYVAPELFSDTRVAELTARTRAVNGESRPLEVIFDTLLLQGSFSGVVTGIAVNTTDSILPSMVAALVVDSANPARPLESNAGADPETRDTLEYYLGPVPPRAVRTFLGGSLDRGVVVGRTAYPASAVQGRRIAGGLDRFWTSRAAYREPDKVRELDDPPK